MFAGYQTTRGARRGVILIVVLGMLGLMALIGVTFATYSAQARISARQFSLAHNEPEPTEVMDFALSQLVDDTFNPISAIRGHSLKRDMYGNDATTNGYLTASPSTGGALMFTAASPVTSGALSGTIQCTMNVAANDYGFYGYDFTRWIVRFPAQAIGGVYNVSESFEVIADDYSGSGARILYLVPRDNGALLTEQTASPPQSPPPVVTNPPQITSGAYPNGSTVSQLIGQSTGPSGTWVPVSTSSVSYPFILDGRYLRAFNGPGLSAPVSYTSSGGTLYTAPANVYGNFRVNGPLLGSPYGPLGDPNAVGMDEDYDACDLDNWFLAIQSADGQVVIPSFHRPAIIRADPTNIASNDWNNFGSTPVASRPAPADSMARILRPRAKEHPQFAQTYPDPFPNSTGNISYDVDNDGDGLTDSVWLDLGYPVRRDPTGRAFKPLYAFLIIGLNGRLPLNTAGNLQLVDDYSGTYSGTQFASLYMQASRLGYSPSEIDPTYALQNAVGGGYSQTDNAGVYVNLTQLRNILAGTRPQASLTSAYSSNGDLNMVTVNNGSWYLPNGQADAADSLSTINGNSVLLRGAPAVAGRWGESGWVPGYPPINAITGSVYSTSIAAGLSMNYSPDPGSGANSPVGVEDDNFTAFDPTGLSYDLLDPSASLMIPTERVRRFTSPIDLSGNGMLASYSVVANAQTTGNGPDGLGRVMFQKYFRPPGLPTTLGNNPPVGSPDYTTNPLHGFDAARHPSVTVSGNASVQSLVSARATRGYAKGPRMGQNEADEMRLYTPNEYDQAFDVGDLQWLYRLEDVDGSTLTSRLSSLAPVSFLNPADGSRRRRMFALDAWETTNFVWAPDNPQNAFPDNSRFGYFPNPLTPPSGSTYLPVTANASFANLNLTSSSSVVSNYPYGYFSPQYNSSLPGGYGGSSAYLPTNTIPNLSAPSNPYQPTSVFLYDNSLTGVTETLGTAAAPHGYDPSTLNYLSAPTATPAVPMTSWPMPTPPLAHRDRKINLNYPLPISNDPNEPVRQKWIRETYYMLKAMLPPQSIDTPAECAQLSQFVINIIDFRDPDGTMTHWVNPDVAIVPPVGGASPSASQLVWTSYALLNNINYWDCDQFGMEYLPVAINEVLAYSFLRKDQDQSKTTTPTAAAIPTNRFFVELVNTLTQSGSGPTSGISPTGGTAPFYFDPSDGFASGTTASGVNTFGFDLSNWDFVIAEDDVIGRPDPTTGQLMTAGALGTTMAYNELYGPIPLVAGTVSTSPTSGGAATPQNGTIPTSFIDFTQNNPSSGTGGTGTTTSGLQLPKATTRQPIQLPALMPQVNSPGTTPPTTNTSGQMTNYYLQYFVGSGNPSQPTYGTSNTNYSPATGTTNIFTGGSPANSTFPPPWGPTATSSMQQKAALNYFFVMGNLLPVIPQQKSSSGSEFLSNGQTAPEYAPPLTVNPIPDQMLTFVDGDTAAASKTSPVQIEYDVFDSVWKYDLTAGGLSPPSGYLTNSQVNPPTDGTNPTLINANNTSTIPANIHAPQMLIYPLPQLAPPSATGTTSTPGTTKYYWLYLRRPANPFQQTTDVPANLKPTALPQPPVSGPGSNPMVVVDCMRFAYIEGTGSVTKIDQNSYANDTGTVSPSTNRIYSIQRLQPFRGGHTVLTTLASGASPYGTINGAIPAYGLSEQTAPATATTMQPGASKGNYGYFGQLSDQVTHQIYETLGQPNIPCEPADYFPFNDRDFMSVAELTLVPGCPPGLFTKQFVENAPENFVPTLPTTLTMTTPATFVTSSPQITPPSTPAGMAIAGPLVSQFTNFSTGTAPPAQPVVPHVYPYLNDNFFYSGASPQLLNPITNTGTNPSQQGGNGPSWPKVGGPSGAGWHKMFELFEVPSPALGATDKVANGSNYDWSRQDTKPGLVNLNLVIDEEVWLGLMGNAGLPNDSRNLTSIPMLNSTQITNASVPYVVTLTDTSGSPYYNGTQLMAYAMNNVGFYLSSSTSNAMKAAFSDFLKLRHGGSGYIFAWGSGPVGNMPTGYNSSYPLYPLNSPASERPFHALSYPDINYTIMRPAALPPPSASANPTPAVSATAYPLATNIRPSPANGGPGLFWDPGVKDPYALYPYTPPGVTAGMTTTYPNAGTDTYPVAAVVANASGTLVNTFEPADTPPRRLFQIPDAYGYPTVTLVSTPPPYFSNAGLWGTGSGTSPTAGTGRNNYVQDFALTNNMFDLTGGSTVYLGNATSSATNPPFDNRQHPYYRTEWLQKVMNLTTVRTHQFAVWITVGFFEVTKQGDPSLANDTTNYSGAIDILGDELNASTGRNKRLRSFFLLDRTKATGFNPGTPGDFRTVVTYRQVIQQ